ncbi:MAG: hypothetical protein KBT20_06190 [Bacteroidales bacterium]|nr:hypothetical protein [Candidatus Liminaster caballi]
MLKLKLKKNIIPWLRDQLSRPKWPLNFFITGNAWASFSINSHIRRSNGEPKISYPTKEAALKVAEKMSKKYGMHFSVYKCLYCDGWHCGKNKESKKISDIIEANMALSPLSIYYEPSCPIRYGWKGNVKSMSEILLHIKDEEIYLDKTHNNISDALLQFFISCSEFRKRLLDEAEEPIVRKELQMSKLTQNVADLYFTQISAFRKTVIKLVNAKSSAYMSYLFEAIETDYMMQDYVWRVTGGREGRAFGMVKKVSLFNEEKMHLAKDVITWYKEKRMCVIPTTGKADLITPASFLGFSGESAMGESFAICPETFEDGYIVLKCDKWQDDDFPPKIIEERCSGIKVVSINADTIVLTLDRSALKDSLVFGNNILHTSETGEYVVAISEAGEFVVEIYYRKSMDASESEDIRVFAYNFCCK